MATAFATSLRHQFHLHKECDAFSLVELMIAVAIVGILGAVALPQYLNQIQKTRQNEAAATVSQIQTTIAAFVEEMGQLPESWGDLNKITPLMTPEGPANQTNFAAINLASAGCTESQLTECYQVDASELAALVKNKTKTKQIQDKQLKTAQNNRSASQFDSVVLPCS